MSLDLLILIVCTVAISILGLLVVARNPRQPDNRRFAYLSVGLLGWTLSNYLSDNAISNVTLFTRITFFTGVIAIHALITFIINFPTSVASEMRKQMAAHFIIMMLLLLTIFTPVFISSVEVFSGGGKINTGSLYYLFIFYVAYSLWLFALAVYKQNINAKNVMKKQQLHIISWGIALYAVFATLSNVVLPLVINSWTSSRLGPAFTLFLVATVGYSIAKHKLFDIRLVVARSVSYILTISTIGFVYGYVAFGIVGRVLFKNQPFSSSEQFVYTVLAVILAFTFPPIQRFFNKITNRFFYRDSYDQQGLLNKLGTIFALEINSKKVTRQSLDIICSEMKIRHGQLITINDDKTVKVTIYGEIKDSINDIKLLNGLKSKVTSMDDIESVIPRWSELHDLDVSVIVRLVTKDGLIGYLLLGPKESGNIYNSQDIDVLTIVSNEMAIALQNSNLFERITQFNITLQAKVDEATRKLRRTNEKLKALDESKDDFISMASHQLRTPLTSIKGYISMVLEGDAGKVSPMQHEMLGQAFFSSQRMVYLISDLLNVSRLKTGKFIIERNKVNLATMVAQELDQLKETAAARQLTLTHEATDNFPDLMLDETKTRQVVMNFVDNAIYYTPAGGHINVKLTETPTTVELRVIDDGIGVSVSDQHHLFTKFYRAGNARKARPDGTGLGLFMAKKVIIAEEGSLIFESAEGKGSTFGFVFYKSKAGVTK